MGALAALCAAAPAAAETVIVRLDGPSLAEVAPPARASYGLGTTGSLRVHGFGARLFRARLGREQAAFARRLRLAVPGARIVRRYALVINAVSVTAPDGAAPRIARLAGVRRVYPQVRYRALADTVPTVVGAPALWGPRREMAGQGVKIGIIDDGVDVRSPFLSGRGMRAPAGFPRGQRALTSAKVIVARSFASARAPRGDRLAFDPRVSEHGTHVAGIAAGRFGTVGKLLGLRVPGLSGVAPEAYIGNYRGLDSSDQGGVSGSTDDIAAAVEAAVADGMDVLNLSLGGTQIDARSDALAVVIEGAARAGVPTVVAAGNEFEEQGFGSIGSPGSAAAAITVAAATTTRIFARAARASGAGLAPVLASFPAVPAVDPQIPVELARPRRIVAAARAGLDPRACRTPAARVPRGALVLVQRGGCSFVVKSRRAAAAGAIGMVVANDLPGTPFEIADALAIPAVMVADVIGAPLRAALAGGTPIRIAIGHRTREVPVSPRVLASFSSAGPTPFDGLLKPDLAAPGVMVVSSLPRSRYAAWDGTSMAAPAVAGAVALLRQQHPAWTPAQLKSALMLTATPAFADSAGTVEASTLREGAGFISLAPATTAPIAVEPASLDLGLVTPGSSVVRVLAISDLQAGEGTWLVGVVPQAGSSGGVVVTAPPQIALVTGATVPLEITAAIDPAAPAGDATGFVTLTRADRTLRIPYWIGSERPALATAAPIALRGAVTVRGTTRGRTSLVDRYRYPDYTKLTPLPQHWRGGEALYRIELPRAADNFGATVESRARVQPLLLTAPDENRLAGESGLPIDVGPVLSGEPIPVAGLVSAQPGTYYIVVDSATAAGAGSFRLHVWIDDERPPIAGRLRVSRHGRGLRLALPLRDAGSGVDPRWFSCGLARVGDSGSCGEVAFHDGNAIVTVPDAQRGATYALALQVGDYAQSRDVNAVGPSPKHVTVVKAAVRVRLDGSVVVLRRVPAELARQARGELVG